MVVEWVLTTKNCEAPADPAIYSIEKPIRLVVQEFATIVGYRS